MNPLHPDISRREWLKGAAALSIAAPAMQADRTPDLHFPVKPRERLAVTSYPFRAYIESPTNRGRDQSKPGMDLKEFAAMIAKRFGVHNINPLSDHFSSTTPDYIAELREAVGKAGSHVVDLGLGGKSFAEPDAAKRKAAIEYGQKWIDIAVALGSPSVRQHLRAPAVVDVAAESLGKLAEYGAKRNIIVNLENDSAISEDPYFILHVLEKVNSPYLRSLPDFGNSIQGHDEEYNEKAVNALFKYAYGMSHVKDKVQSKGTMYEVNVAKMFDIAKANSYRGYFSMEVDTASEDPFEGTKALVALSLKCLA
jgi:sugar phosphate isomerase/epimerase